MIYTREQLIHELVEIIDNHITVDYEDKHAYAAAVEIADLIATLNKDDDPLPSTSTWRSIP